MLIGVYEIKVGSRLKRPVMERVKTLASGMETLGLLCPIAVDEGYRLITGLSRSEAAKLLKRAEIEREVEVKDASVLQAELAEIDAIAFRKKISDLEFCDLLLRRKEIYETLHPETRNGGDRKSAAWTRKINTLDTGQRRVKSFAQETADKLAVSPATVERRIRIAKKLTPEAKRILRGISGKIPYRTMRMIADMSPGEQRQAALLLLKNGANMDRNLLMSSLSSP